MRRRGTHRISRNVVLFRHCCGCRHRLFRFGCSVTKRKEKANIISSSIDSRQNRANSIDEVRRRRKNRIRSIGNRLLQRERRDLVVKWIVQSIPFRIVKRMHMPKPVLTIPPQQLCITSNPPHGRHSQAGWNLEKNLGRIAEWSALQTSKRGDWSSIPPEVKTFFFGEIKCLEQYIACHFEFN